MRYIQELHEGSSVKDIYLCKKRMSLVTKNGKNYESLTLQDKTGVIDAKIWDPNSMGIGEFEELDYVDIAGDVVSFQGHLQLNIKRARKCQEGEYNPADYVPVSDKNIDDMMGAIGKYIDSVKNEYLQRLLKAFFVEDKEFIEDFRLSSAAKSVFLLQKLPLSEQRPADRGGSSPRHRQDQRALQIPPQRLYGGGAVYRPHHHRRADDR